ncbi:MAG: trehalase-like domain-containing protein, partial [Thermodesulfobacteriota bacterium]|nr:trehalase-like domain-containing protein [Thermodesulfobacteriota bacterium]
MPYLPIESYGIIGDMHTVALVGMNGSIDWFCFPNFDSPSVFGAILDNEKGGFFKISPTVEGITHKQFYWPDTNVLITRFLSADGVGEITDYMTAPTLFGESEYQHKLLRSVKVVRGTMSFKLECTPAFNYARDPHSIKTSLEGASFHSHKLSLALSSSLLLKQVGNGVARE